MKAEFPKFSSNFAACRKMDKRGRSAGGRPESSSVLVAGYVRFTRGLSKYKRVRCVDFPFALPRSHVVVNMPIAFVPHSKKIFHGVAANCISVSAVSLFALVTVFRQLQR